MRRVPGRRALSDERERGPAAVVTNMVTHDQQTTSAVARDWDMLIERRVDFAKDDPTHRGHRIHVRRTIPLRGQGRLALEARRTPPQLIPVRTHAAGGRRRGGGSVRYPSFFLGRIRPGHRLLDVRGGEVQRFDGVTVGPLHAVPEVHLLPQRTPSPSADTRPTVSAWFAWSRPSLKSNPPTLLATSRRIGSVTCW